MTKRQQQYNENKQAKVGKTITCPVCGSMFTKKQYSQAFCCSFCKDKYWNDKGDRHDPSYYEEYDKRHPERRLRRELYGSTQVVSVSGELSPRHQEDILTNFLKRKGEVYA